MLRSYVACHHYLLSSCTDFAQLVAQHLRPVSKQALCHQPSSCKPAGLVLTLCEGLLRSEEQVKRHTQASG